jgi:hypothetical protein
MYKTVITRFNEMVGDGLMALQTMNNSRKVKGHEMQK